MNSLKNFEKKTKKNIHQPLLMTWLYSGVRGQGHTVVQLCGDNDIHVNAIAGASKSVF